MIRWEMVMLMVVVGAMGWGGCQSAPAHRLLAVPPGTMAEAARRNDEGIQAYAQQQYGSAKQHFEAAIAASPDLAEAHYNLGMALYKLGAFREGKTHFIKAANLAPGNKAIWDSPPLKSVRVPSRESGASDGDSHRH